MGQTWLRLGSEAVSGGMSSKRQGNPLDPKLEQPLASGRTAEIYPWNDGRILKLYRSGEPRSAAQRELAINRRVTDAGIAAPQVFEGDAADGLVEIGGRVGIVFQRVDGPSMLADLMVHPWRLICHARALAGLHARMQDHEVTAPQFDDQKALLARRISAAANHVRDIDEARWLQRLESLPAGDRLCHGDFHPDNVLLSRENGGAKPVTLDWENAAQGDPAGDVARTVLILRIAGGTPDSSRWAQMLIRLLARSFLRTGPAGINPAYSFSSLSQPQPQPHSQPGISNSMVSLQFGQISPSSLSIMSSSK